jgi:hypothetical protein
MQYYTGAEQMRMKTTQIFGMIALGLVFLFSFNGCKNFGVPNYDLKIQLEGEVQGTPLPGVYTYTELETISYSYVALNSDYSVEVIVNGSRWNSEGEFIMYSNMDVVVRIIDIRGKWLFKLVDADQKIEDREFTITFSGDSLLIGTFTDSQGYSGTWEIEGKTITITYSNWLDYVLTGSITTMSGNWTGVDLDGTWTATRQE